MLSYFGLGPIKGFAVVLIIGILSSLFTAVLVSRLLIDWWTGKGKDLQFSNSLTKGALSGLSVDWMSKRKVAYLFSSVLVLLSLVSIFTRGFEFGVDFKGGYSYNIQFSESVNPEELRKELTTAFYGNTPVVKSIDSENSLNVVTSYLIDSGDENASQKVLERLFAGVNNISGNGLDIANFSDPEGTGTHIVSSSQVGPTVAEDIKTSSFRAALFALALIFLYIFIRFSKWQYSAGAVIALFHDTIITLGVFSALHGILPFSMEVDQAFIAAILTVIGYSINDTVVVFDRIREMMGIYIKRSRHEVINKAINNTLSRTTLTSLTTLFVVLVLFLFGGSSIKGFSFAILFGIVIGTYSSIFVAAPLMSDLLKKDEVTKA
jgi:SecD/SecF fusion protein